MSNTAPSLNLPRIEALLPLMRGWLFAVAHAVLALAQRSSGRHRRLLRPFVLRLERNLANWLFLSAFLRVTPPPDQRSAKRPRSVPRGFRRARTHGAVMRRYLRLRRPSTLAGRLQHIAGIAANPERAIAHIVTRLNALTQRGGFIGARLIAMAPPARTLTPNTQEPAPALADSS